MGKIKIAFTVRLLALMGTFCTVWRTWAATEVVDGITWTYTVSNGGASVGGGEYNNTAIPTSTAGAITIPSTLGGYSVTSIDTYAFWGCASLESVTIPDSVTSIGYNAFQGCSGLASVTIPDSVTSIGYEAFYGCSGLESVTIPDSVTSIGYNAFYGCSGLTSVTIPDSVTFIGDWAFYGCSGLTSVTIPDSVTNIGSYAFSGCSGLISFVIGSDNVKYSSSNGLLLSKDSKTLIFGVNGDVTIPDSVTSIGNYAFSGCSGLTSVTIPDSVTNIGSHAFSGCSGLTSVTIPDSVTSIGDGAFHGCSGLADGDGFIIVRNALYYYIGASGNVTIPDSVTSIGYEAFSNCGGLTSVTIGAGCTSINNNAFDGCWNLLEINVDEANTAYSSVDGVLYDKNVRNLIFCPNGVSYLTLPDTVSSVYQLPDNICSLTLGSGTSVYNNLPSNLRAMYIRDSWWSMPTFDEQQFEYLQSDFKVFVDAGSPYVGRIWNGFTVEAAPCWEDEGICYSISGGVLTVTKRYGDSSIENRHFCNKYRPDYSSYVFEVEIKDGINIGDYAFQSFYELRKVTISEGTSKIGARAFYYCGSLASVNIPSSVKSIGEDPFFGCWELGVGVVSIDNCLVRIGNGPITYNGIPDGTRLIADKTFANCSELTSVTIPGSVTIIGESAFCDCIGLTSLVISDGVASIGDRAFSGCSGLTSVTIPDSVTSIGNYAFYNCSGLTSVHISDLAAWCNISFYSYGSNPLYYAKKLYLDGEQITELTIPDSVTSIGNYAFSGCSGLTSVTIPDGVEHIGKFAFPSYIKLYVSEGNTHFKKINNAVYSAGGQCVWEPETSVEVISTDVRNNDPTILDITYIVHSDKDYVDMRAMAYEDGSRAWSKVIRPETFVLTPDGCQSVIGDDVACNTTNVFSWKVSADYSNNLAKLKVEIFAKPEDLLPMDLMQLPVRDGKPALEFSYNTLSDANVMNALYWLYASGDPDLALSNGVLKNGNTQLANGGSLNGANAAQYVIRKMGYEPLTSANHLNYVNTETRLGLSPNGTRQYAVKEITE